MGMRQTRMAKRGSKERSPDRRRWTTTMRKSPKKVKTKHLAAPRRRSRRRRETPREVNKNRTKLGSKKALKVTKQILPLSKMRRRERAVKQRRRLLVIKLEKLEDKRSWKKWHFL